MHVQAVLENPVECRGRLDGTGSLSENPGSAPETNGERPRIIGWGDRVTQPRSGASWTRKGASPNRERSGSDTVSDREEGKRAKWVKIMCVNYRLHRDVFLKSLHIFCPVCPICPVSIQLY